MRAFRDTLTAVTGAFSEPSPQMLTTYAEERGDENLEETLYRKALTMRWDASA